MSLPVSINSGGAAAARNGQYKRQGPLHFTGSNSWHTYALLFITACVTYKGMLHIHCMHTYALLFITAYVTYKGMLPIHCMLASLWSNACMDLLYDTMNNNTDSVYNVVCIIMIIVHTAD